MKRQFRLPGVRAEFPTSQSSMSVKEPDYLIPRKRRTPPLIHVRHRMETESVRKYSVDADSPPRQRIRPALSVTDNLIESGKAELASKGV
jgi:hypothetical protein